MRFRFLSFLIVIAVAVLIVALNLRQSRTVTEPYPMKGLVQQPPYEMKLMTISVYTDQGWPIWHTRASDHFAAHNAALFIDEGGLPHEGVHDPRLQYEQATPQTDPVRAGIDVAIGLLILIVTAAASETALRTFRRRPVNVDDLRCPEAELGDSADTGRI
jgi:hypothetical protein